MTTPRHGYNALVYVSGTEISGANAWSIDIATDAIVTNVFGDTWKKRAVGQSDWSGSLTAWDENNDRLLMDAATAQVAVALLIYPTRDDQADYYSGNAIFGARTSGGVTAAVDKSGDFVGDDTLTIAGWA